MVPMETSLSVVLAAVFVVGFVRFAPKGADQARLRSFNRQALGFLLAICIVALGLLCWRAPSVDSAILASTLFVTIFVPLYILCSGALRSRLLAPHSDGGRFTL